MRTTRFGNGAEKVRKITVTKPDAMAARKKDKEENETLDDLEHNEDGRGCCYQPLLKTYPEAADRSPSSIANVLRDLMRGGQQELRTGIASHFSPGLAALPHFQTMVFFFKLGFLLSYKSDQKFQAKLCRQCSVASQWGSRVGCCRLQG